MHFLVKNNIFDNLSTIFYRWGIKLELFLDDFYFIIIFMRVCQNIFFPLSRTYILEFYWSMWNIITLLYIHI